MEVELDIFSGRPNPRWRVGEEVERRLRALEEAMPPAAAEGQPPALGYRGFLYAIAGERRRAFNGRIERPGRPLADRELLVERALLDTLPAELAPLRARVAAAIGGGD